jgi:hypothetical protein
MIYTPYSWFSSSSDQHKIVLLAWLSHELTIHGRCFAMDLSGQKAIDAFKGLNELQHTISNDIGHLAKGTNRKSGEVILQCLEVIASQCGLSADLRWSLERISASQP